RSRASARQSRSGLARWQEQRVEELLSANLDGNISIADLARECGLPISEFRRAFKHSAGTLPHEWLLLRRVDKAKDLLCRSRLSLGEVAFASGFANKRHFARVFTRLAGASPQAWRDSHGLS